MSRILKTQIKDYTKEMDINFFCILRQFINMEMMNNIINKVNYFNEKYPYDEGLNPYISNKKRRTNNLYSDFGSENDIMKNWPEEKREGMLDKYYDVRKGMWKELREILSSIFYLLKKRQWKLTGITLFDVYPGCSEQEIHMDMPRILPKDMIRYYISIPFHETTKNMGPIIYYKESMMKEFRKFHKYDENNENDGGIIGHLNSLKWEIKQVFLNAREQYEYKFGDISIHRDITFHNGGTNNSNKIRRFLFIVCDVRN
tara:strand:+ start:5108 stop:5881 length:774 start_codon:yes stop_codon:yes gene_type:complete